MDCVWFDPVWTGDRSYYWVGNVCAGRLRWFGAMFNRGGRFWSSGTWDEGIIIIKATCPVYVNKLFKCGMTIFRLIHKVGITCWDGEIINGCRRRRDRC